MLAPKDTSLFCSNLLVNLDYALAPHLLFCTTLSLFCNFHSYFHFSFQLLFCISLSLSVWTLPSLLWESWYQRSQSTGNFPRLKPSGWTLFHLLTTIIVTPLVLLFQDWNRLIFTPNIFTPYIQPSSLQQSRVYSLTLWILNFAKEHLVRLTLKQAKSIQLTFIKLRGSG